VKTRKFNDEVLYPADKPVVLDRAFVEWLKQQADLNPRRRIRLCAHQDPSEPIHEMLIVHDALIAAGSSGGPLLDDDGRVLGVNAILTKRRGDRTNAYDRAIAVNMTPILQRLGRLAR